MTRGGLANIVISNSIVLKNNYYYTLWTEFSSNPPTLLEHTNITHTGIADSGASGIYFAPNVPVANLNPNVTMAGVHVANGLPVKSIASATLASVPALPDKAVQGHAMPSFPTPSLA